MLNIDIGKKYVSVEGTIRAEMTEEDINVMSDKIVTSLMERDVFKINNEEGRDLVAAREMLFVATRMQIAIQRTAQSEFAKLLVTLSKHKDKHESIASAIQAVCSAMANVSGTILGKSVVSEVHLLDLVNELRTLTLDTAVAVMSSERKKNG